MRDAAQLIYKATSGKLITDVITDIYVEKTDVYGQEFHLSYQSGLNVQYAFKTNRYDFESSEHKDPDTAKALFASQLKYDGAVYNIIRHQNIKDSNDVLLLCN
jgi:hypothetical protein